MPDDPQAKAQLDAAVDRVRRVFVGRPGSSDCGDALPHHPDQQPGMSDRQVAALARRPAELPCSALSWREVSYFFGHAGWTMNPQETLPAAFRYFLPRLAEATLPPQPPAGLEYPFEAFVLERLVIANWQSWPQREVEVISGWLAAWGTAIICWQSEDWVAEGYELGPFDPSNRSITDLFEGLLSVLDLGILEPALNRLDALGWVRLLRGVFTFGDFSLPQDPALLFPPQGMVRDVQVPGERQRALMERLTRPGLAELVLSAPHPPQADVQVWDDTCLEAARTVERIRARLTAHDSP